MACAADDLAAPLTDHFGARPVYVQASSELPDACLLALDESARFYGSQGATLALSVVDPGTRSLYVPVGGVVGVLPGKLSMDVHGETRRALTIGGSIFGAEVTLASCRLEAVAHELGHALGLEHVSEWGNLMYGGLDGITLTLTDTQVAWIRD